MPSVRTSLFTLMTFTFIALFSIPYCLAQVTFAPSQAELNAIVLRLDQIDRLIAEKESLLQQGIGNREDLILEIRKQKERKIEFGERFMSVAAGINSDETKEKEVEGDKKRNLVEELQVLVIPVIDGLQRMSARPRQIEALRRRVDIMNSKIVNLTQGQKRIDILLQDQQLSSLKGRLTEAKNDLGSQVSDLEIYRDDLNRELERELAKDRSLVDSFSELMRSFFGRRGKNLFLAIIIFNLVWWVMWRFRHVKRLQELFVARGWTFLFKPFRLLYPFVVFLCAFTASLLSLYFLNDWLLVTIMSFILLSLLWSLKQVIPRFIQEGKLMLNLGTVKEKERVVFGGLPWIIESLGFVAELKNPLLEGKGITIPSRRLLDYYSTPIVEGEKWFPSSKGDFVLLSDGVYGEVLLQTSEQVVIKSVLGAHCHYPTLRYLELTPQNYSNGFSREEICSLDHSEIDFVQANGPTIERELEQLFKEKYPSIKYEHFSLAISHFDGYGVHLVLQLSCPGQMSSRYTRIPRMLQNTFLFWAKRSGRTLPTPIIFTNSYKKP